MKAAHAQIPAMQQTLAFREAERHDAAVYMVAPWGVDGRLVEASNDLFRERFRGVEEVRAFLHVYVVARVVPARSA